MKRLLVTLIFTCACYSLQAQVNIITTIAGTDSMGYAGDGGPCMDAIFHYPDAMCLDNSGNLYVVDGLNHRIRKIVLSTGIISTVAGTDTFGYSGDGIQATDAELWLPNGICLDTSGNVYIADGFNHRVRKVTVSTGIITTVVGTGNSGNSGDGGQATSAEIDAPGGVSIDRLGNMYISDNFNDNVRKVTPDGIITTIAGIGTQGYSGDGGPATNAQLYLPQKAIADNYGNVLISDAFNNALRKVNAITGIITTIAGNGTAGYYGNGVLATDALLSEPHGIYIDQHNNVLFAEWGNGTLRRIDAATGIITTIAGTGMQGFSGDGGTPAAAQLIPEDLCFDSYGSMYIADFGNQRIRMIYNPKLATPVFSEENAISVYPNPASNEFTIENAAGSEMRIFDLLGQEKMSSKAVSDKDPFDIRSLPAGAYIVHITGTNGEVQNLRLLKE